MFTPSEQSSQLGSTHHLLLRSSFSILILAASLVFSPHASAATQQFHQGTVGYNTWKWSGHQWNKGAWAMQFMSSPATPALTHSGEYVVYHTSGSEITISFSTQFVAIGCGHTGSSDAYMFCDRYY